MTKVADKNTGSYYTPHETVKFMYDYLQECGRRYECILEPSAGDGRFIDQFDDGNTQIVAVELIDTKVEEIRQKKNNAEVFCMDFLEYALKCTGKFQLIIGNPPYINQRYISESTNAKIKKICRILELNDSIVKNMWVAFLLASVMCMEENGAIFFVLPLEFLQVKYAESLRKYLESRFNTIHILLFKERMFPKIEQESCLVYLTNIKGKKPCIDLKIYNELSGSKCISCSVIERNKPLVKWSNAILPDSSIDFLKETGEHFLKISDICNASPGIVTGANNEFILNHTQVEQLQCQKYVLPIISKSTIVEKRLIVSDEIVDHMKSEGNRIYLLNLSNIKKEDMPSRLINYLNEIGNKENLKNEKLKDRYKCKSREPWYGVPIVRNGDLFFFKRYDKLPRICINRAGIHSTDIAYNMRIDTKYDPESLAFCFYNSITLAYCEFLGRYYAGGVAELTPSEFKKLPIPYYKIDKADINVLDRMLQTETDTERIIHFVNSKTLIPNMGVDNVTKMDHIRKMLLERRIRKTDDKRN